MPGYGGAGAAVSTMNFGAAEPFKAEFGGEFVSGKRGKVEEGSEGTKCKREVVWIGARRRTPEPEPGMETMREGFEDWRKRTKGGGKNRVMLNVGGRLFETSMETLCDDGQSMLAAKVMRHMEDEDEIIWIDRDPDRFQHVLNYLRSRTIWLDKVSELRAVQEEADFFNLEGLHRLCEEKIRESLAVRDQRQQILQRMEELQGTLKLLTEGLDIHKTSQRKEPISGVRRRRLDYGNYNEPVFRMDEDF